MKRIAMAVAATLVALALTACGSSGSATSSSASSPSLADGASPEVKEALSLLQKEERFRAMAQEGIERSLVIQNVGAAKAMEEVAYEYLATSKAAERQLRHFDGQTQNRALLIYNAEH